MKQSNRYTFNN